MFYNIKKKAILDNSNKLLDILWGSNKIEKEKIEISRQIINNSITVLSLENICISNLLIENNFLILNIGCGVMTWEKDIIDICKNNPIYENIYLFCVDNYNYFKNINEDEFESIKNILNEVNLELYIYNVVDEGLKYRNETMDFIFQRDMISVYKIHQWNDIINEIYRVLKKGCYAELIEYDINIKSIIDGNTEISDIFNKTLVNIFKINGQETNIINIYEKIIILFGKKNVKLIKKQIPLYYEDNFKGLMLRNMLLGYSYFKSPLSDTLKLKGYSFDKSFEILKEEWKNNKSYMELYIFSAIKK